MQVISNIALITINETLFVQLISFLLFMVIMDRLMFRPLRKVMHDRASYIDKLRTEIEDAEQELNNVNDQLRKEEAAMRNRAFGFKEELEEAGNRQAAEVIKAAEEEIGGLREKTKAEIELQISEARKYIRTESQVLAVNIMEKILDRRVSA